MGAFQPCLKLPPPAACTPSGLGAKTQGKNPGGSASARAAQVCLSLRSVLLAVGMHKWKISQSRLFSGTSAFPFLH
jgi:hypothetical protein